MTRHDSHQPNRSRPELAAAVPPTAQSVCTQLDRWCREHDVSTTSNHRLAREAARRAGDTALPRKVSIRASATDRGTAVGPDPRRWPAAARYRLADLERTGIDREPAVATVLRELSGSLLERPATVAGEAGPACR